LLPLLPLLLLLLLLFLLMWLVDVVAVAVVVGDDQMQQRLRPHNVHLHYTVGVAMAQTQ